MPPTTRYRHGRGQEIILVAEQDRQQCSPFLTDTYLTMMRETKRQLECPVCLVDLMACPTGRCVVLKVCGHAICVRCERLAAEADENGAYRCPLCRS